MAYSQSASYPEYSEDQLKAALDSLLEGSSDPSFDGRHLFGFQDPNHKLSKLQAITATRILDYETYLVRTDGSLAMTTHNLYRYTGTLIFFLSLLATFQADPSTPSEDELKPKIQDFWAQHGSILNLQEVIRSQSPRMALAAEFKRASPSKGDIAVHLDAGEQAQNYAMAGANIISVLTEPRWFKGGLDDMKSVRLQTTQQKSYARPAVLRKEFTTNTYQITEAMANGADTILLIVAVLPQHLLKELIDHARSFGMEPLVEVHADSELEVAVQAGAKIIGVNNRNLHTFQMDLHTTEHVAELLTQQGCVFDHNDPNSDYTICSLSGMSTAFDVNRYRKINVGMCLIGESLMRAADPKAAIVSLCLDPKEFETSTNLAGGAYTGGTKLVKVCGVTNADDAKVACQAGANLIGVIFVPKSKRCVTPEQAKSVVEMVQTFGERTSRTILAASKQESPLNQLVSNAFTLEDASRRPMVVGVFQNQSPEFIREMVEECGLDMVQLHGNEGMQAANEENCGVPAIRVVDIETDPETGKASSNAAKTLLESITADPVAILLDTSIKGSKDGGGTGVTFDWGIAEQVQNAGLPVIIAGGLTPDNIDEAVTSTRPWGVDVSSGVEASPGTKDHDKVRQFVGGARKAAIEASKGF
jgi:anthranilate synthase/indole-3-glycerol phosphate synthase/phosphoribosylanthranilate isomerase